MDLAFDIERKDAKYENFDQGKNNFFIFLGDYNKL